MIYLDNASTTKPSEAVRAAVIGAMEGFGNPSSMHGLGISAEKLIKDSADAVARVMGVNASNIVFTSGGTESNNTAILAYCRRNRKRGNHIITTQIEHPSVLEPFRRLEAEGFEVTRVGVLPNGELDLDEFENALCPDTLLVSCMWVNNETGVIQPVEKLKSIMKAKALNAVLHVDGVQAFGKIPVKPQRLGIDMMSVSGHKVHAVKGIGALYVRDGINFESYLVGGGQQKDMRSGTENVPGIAALGTAAKELEIEADFEKLTVLKSMFKEEIIKRIPNVKINGEGSPYILNASFTGIKAEILLHALEGHEIYVSTGSACSTNKPMPSHVLTAMGCSRAEIDGAVRFSLNAEITEADIIKTAEILEKEVEFLRKVMR